MAALADLMYNVLLYFTVASLGGLILGPLLALVFMSPWPLLWFLWAVIWLLVLIN